MSDEGPGSAIKGYMYAAAFLLLAAAGALWYFKKQLPGGSVWGKGGLTDSIGGWLNSVFGETSSIQSPIYQEALANAREVQADRAAAAGADADAAREYLSGEMLSIVQLKRANEIRAASGAPPVSGDYAGQPIGVYASLETAVIQAGGNAGTLFAVDYGPAGTTANQAAIKQWLAGRNYSDLDLLLSNAGALEAAASIRQAAALNS